MDQLDLSIIIVDYKSKKYLLDCFRSIKKYVKDIKYEVVIVDNNQEPESIIKNQELKEILPAPYSLLPSSNKGFGGGNNLGAQKARGRYLLLLNPDTLIVDNSILKLLDFLKTHDEIGALTCLLYQKDKTLQKNFFGKFQSLASVTIRRYNYQEIDLSKEFFYTDIVTGACLMIKRELYKKIDGFDENIFMYLEDDDLCKRLVDLGYKNAVLNTAEIVHFEGQSSGSKQRKQYYYNSQDYYWKKHNGLIATSLMKILRWPYKILKTRI